MGKAVKIVLAFGGNIGDTAAVFRSAAAALTAGGVKDLRMSSLFRTSPEKCVPGTPDFINAAAIGFWSGTPRDLLSLTAGIEIASGRPSAHRSDEARVLDIDIILFGDAEVHLVEPELDIPHPRARLRRFVLEPLAELDAGLRFPDSGRTVGECLHFLPR